MLTPQQLALSGQFERHAAELSERLVFVAMVSASASETKQDDASTRLEGAEIGTGFARAQGMCAHCTPRARRSCLRAAAVRRYRALTGGEPHAVPTVGATVLREGWRAALQDGHARHPLSAQNFDALHLCLERACGLTWSAWWRHAEHTLNTFATPRASKRHTAVALTSDQCVSTAYLKLSLLPYHRASLVHLLVVILPRRQTASRRSRRAGEGRRRHGASVVILLLALLLLFRRRGRDLAARRG